MLAWLLAACDGGQRPAPIIDGPFTVDGPVWTTVLGTAPGAPPPALAALADGLTSEAPSDGSLAERAALGKLHYLLCSDPAARDDIRRTLGDHPLKWRFRRVTECSAPDYCAWVHGVLDSDPSSPWWWGLRECRDARTHDRMADQAPDDAFAEYWWHDTLPYHPRIVQIVRAAFAAEGPPTRPGTTALDVLGDADSPDAEQALLALYDAAPPAWRDSVAVALWGRTSERATAIHAEVCARVEARPCGWTRADRLDPAAWMGVGVLPERLVERFPAERELLVENIATCAWGGDGAARRACARALAHLDPDRIPAEADPDLAVARSPALLGSKLAGLGLDVPADAVLALEVLDRAGKTVELATGATDDVALLYAIAARAGIARPGFAESEGLEFSSLPAPDLPDDVDGRVAYRTYLAWGDGLRLRGLAPVGLPAPAAIVPFANAVLAARASPLRVALDLDQRRLVLADAETLHQLAERGLVAFFAWPTPPEAVE